jgi:decaprenyl-phosphate phosphoribosyltransferase
MHIKAYIQLLRPKHYLKNVLVFLPLVFGGLLLNGQDLAKSVLAFVSFSLVASSVYIINDLKDRQLDALHPVKKLRPLASGTVGKPAAIALAVALLMIAGSIQYFAGLSVLSAGLLAFYVLINLLYSFGLKNIPIVDVAILALGFVLRVYYGGEAVGIGISKWLYLSVLAFSFFVSLGKRRNEIRANGTKTRVVNQFYNHSFLDKNMYVCLSLTILYYSLWAIDPLQKHKLIFWTVPVVIVIVMAYSLAVESAQSDGDPVNLVLKNKPLLALIGFYGILMIILVYA